MANPGVSGAFLLFLTSCCLTDAYKYESGIPNPDYTSTWVTLQSNSPGDTKRTFTHGLGEVPALVDVQVKAMSGPNKDFVFTGVGGCPRDDDTPEPFGGAMYVYNHVSVIVAVPEALGTPGQADYPVGYSIYTGSDPYWEGPNSQQSSRVLVRVRAWRMSSLPSPDYDVQNLRMATMSGVADKLYKELNHTLGEVPALVIARLYIIEGAMTGWYSDLVGANLYTASRNNTMSTNRHAIYGFDHQTIRVWAPEEGFLFAADDAYNIGGFATRGDVEIYAWKHSSIRPYITSSVGLGPSVVNETMEQGFQWERSINNVFIRVWAQADSGPNAGYVFPGSGSAAYASSATAQPCSYGGLLYAHDLSTIRFWRPAANTNGSLICISEFMGMGTNQQAEENAIAIVRVWSFSTQEQDNAVELVGMCAKMTRNVSLAEELGTTSSSYQQGITAP